MYFDQLSGAALTRKLVKTFYKFHFQTFFLDFRREITQKGLKLTKKVENGSKECFEIQASKFVRDTVVYGFIHPLCSASYMRHTTRLQNFTPCVVCCEI